MATRLVRASRQSRPAERAGQTDFVDDHAIIIHGVWPTDGQPRSGVPWDETAVLHDGVAQRSSPFPSNMHHTLHTTLDRHYAHQCLQLIIHKVYSSEGGTVHLRQEQRAKHRLPSTLRVSRGSVVGPTVRVADVCGGAQERGSTYRQGEG